jgi:hypothetical protein
MSPRTISSAASTEEVHLNLAYRWFCRLGQQRNTCEEWPVGSLRPLYEVTGRAAGRSN